MYMYIHIWIHICQTHVCINLCTLTHRRYYIYSTTQRCTCATLRKPLSLPSVFRSEERQNGGVGGERERMRLQTRVNGKRAREGQTAKRTLRESARATARECERDCLPPINQVCRSKGVVWKDRSLAHACTHSLVLSCTVRGRKMMRPWHTSRTPTWGCGLAKKNGHGRDMV